MFWLTASSGNIVHKQSLQKENIHSCFSELSFSGWGMELEHLSSDLFCWLPAHDHEQKNYYTNFSCRNHRRGQITNCPGSMGCLYKTWNWIQVFCIPAECLSEQISLINAGTALSLMSINCLASLTYPLEPCSSEYLVLTVVPGCVFRQFELPGFFHMSLPFIGWHQFECPSFFFFYSCAQKERLSISCDITHSSVGS